MSGFPAGGRSYSKYLTDVWVLTYEKQIVSQGRIFKSPLLDQGYCLFSCQTVGGFRWSQDNLGCRGTQHSSSEFSTLWGPMYHGPSVLTF